MLRKNKLNTFFNKELTYAIVGASNNESKYGYKIFKSLKEQGFNVIPVNPKESKIQEVKAYKSLEFIKEEVDVVDFVVPIPVTLKVLKEVKKKDIKKVWFQPGSYNKECLTFCKENDIIYMVDFCLFAAATGKIEDNDSY